MPFLHMTGLGKQVKAAYKAGRLKVGAIERYGKTHSVIATPHCIFAVTENEEPNKMKAIVTEYLGYLPVFDETSANLGFIEAGHELADREIEPNETKALEKLLFTDRRTKAFVLTPVIINDLGSDIRIIQDVVTNHCKGIRQEFLELITNKDLNYEIEGDPMGPEVDEITATAYFRNQTTTLAIQLYTSWTDKSKEILNMLQLIELRD